MQGARSAQPRSLHTRAANRSRILCRRGSSTGYTNPVHTSVLFRYNPLVLEDGQILAYKERDRAETPTATLLAEVTSLLFSLSLTYIYDLSWMLNLHSTSQVKFHALWSPASPVPYLLDFTAAHE